MTQSRNVIKEFGGVLIDSEPVLKVSNEYPVSFDNISESISPESGAVTIRGGLGVEGNICVGDYLVAFGGIDLVNQRVSNLGDPVDLHDAISLEFFNTNSGGIVAGVGIIKDVNTISVSPSQVQISSLGTIRNGTWMADPVQVAYGGLGSTVIPSGHIIFGAGTDPVQTDVAFTYNNITKTLSLGGLNDAQGPGTGTIVVAGGISVNKSVFVGSALNVQGKQTNMGLLSVNNATDVGQGPSGQAALDVLGGVTVGGGLSVRGAASVNGTLTIESNIRCNDLTESDSVTTGSAVFAGGVGLGANLQVGGNTYLTGTVVVHSTDDAALRVGGGARFSKSLEVLGGLTVQGAFSCSSALAGLASVQGNTLSSTSVQDNSLTSSGGLQVAASATIGRDATISRDLFVTRNVAVTGATTVNTLRLSSTDDDAFTTMGGAIFRSLASFQKPVTYQDTIQSTSSIDASSPSTGSVVFAGGLGVGKSIVAGTTITAMSSVIIQGTADTTAPDPGDSASLKTAGGITVQKGAFIGGNTTIQGILTVQGTTDSPLPNLGTILCSGGVGITKGLSVGGQAVFMSTSQFNGSSRYAAPLFIDATDDSISPTLASLVTQGGVSVKRSLLVGANASVGGMTNLVGLLTANSVNLSGKLNGSSVLDATALDNAAAVFAGGLAVGKTVMVGGDLKVLGATNLTGNVSFTGTPSFPNPLRAQAADDATDATTGAIIATGGVGVGKTLFVAGSGVFASNVRVSGALNVNSTLDAVDLTTGSVQLDGGMSVKKGLVVGGSSAFLTQLSAANLTISSNTIANGPVRFFNTFAALGSTTSLGLEADAATAVVIVTQGSFSVSGNSTTEYKSTLDSTSPSSGSVLLRGGLGVAKSVNVGMNLTVQGSSTYVGTVTTNSSLTVQGPFSAMQAASITGLLTTSNVTVTGDLQLPTGLATVSRIQVTDLSDIISGSGPSVRVAGGMSVAKSMLIGALCHVSGSLQVDSGSTLTGATTLNGVLLVRDTTESTGVSNASVVFQGGLSVAKNSTLTSLVVANNTTVYGTITNFSQLVAASTDETTGTGTGAIYAVGGISTAKSLFAGGDLTVTGNTRLLGTVSMATYSISSQSITGTTDSTAPNNGSFTTAGGIGVSKSANIGGTLTSVLLRISSTIEASSPTVAAAVITGGLSVGRGTYLAGGLQVYGIASFSAAVAFTSSLSCNGGVTLSNTTDSTSISTGALTCLGGAGIAKNLNVGGSGTFTGPLCATNTADATSVTSPSGTSLAVLGGAVIVKNLLVGASITASGSLTCSGQLLISNTASISGNVTLTSSSDTSLNVTGGVTVGRALAVVGNITSGAQVSAGSLALSGTADSVDANTGTLVTAGGIAAQRSIFTGGNLTAVGNIVTSGRLSVTINTEATSATNSANPTGAVAVASIATLGGLAVAKSGYFGNVLDVSGPATFRSTLTVISTTDSLANPAMGCATFAGGVGISKSVSVGNSISITGNATVQGTCTTAALIATAPSVFNDTTDSASQTTAALIVKGGVSVGKSIRVAAGISSASLAVTGGTSSATLSITTTIDCSASTRDDSIVTGGGIIVGKGISVSGALTVTGLATFNGGLVSPAPCVFSASVAFRDTTASLSPQTGSVIVAGGIGVGGNVYSSGNVFANSGTLSGSLQIATGLTVSNSGQVLFQSSLEAQDFATAALVTVGGGAFGKSLRVAGNFFLAGTGTFSGSISSGTVTVTGVTDASNSLTGSLIVAGGASVNKSLYVAGQLNALSSSITTGTATFLGSTIMAGLVTLTNATDLTSLVLSGGATVAKGLQVAGTLTSTTQAVFSNVTVSQGLSVNGVLTTTSVADNSVAISGGASVAKSFQIGASCTVGQVLNLATSGAVTGQVSITSGSLFNVNGATITDTTTAAQTTSDGAYVSYFGTPKIIMNNAGVTLTNIATVYIAGAPTLQNVTATKSAALWIGSGQFRVSETLDSTGLGSGCAVLAGGLSVAKSTYIGGNVSVSGSITSIGDVIVQAGGVLRAKASSAATLCFVADGGVTIAGTLTSASMTISSTSARLSSAATLFLDNTSDATQVGDGAVVIQGGVSIAKKLFIGGNFATLGTATVSQQLTTGTLRVLDATGSAITVTGGVTCSSATVSGALSAGTGQTTGDFTVGGAAHVLSTAEATAVDSGCLTLNGGLGLKRSIYVGTNLTVAAVSTFYGISSFSSGVTFAAAVTCTATAPVNVLQADDALSLTSASVVLAGGLAVNKTARIGADMRVAGKTVLDGQLVSKASVCQANASLITLTAGASVSIPAIVPGVILIAGTTMDGIVLNFPPAALCSDGQTIFISNTQPLTNVSATVSGAAFAPNMSFPSTIAAGQAIKYMFIASLALWYKVA